MAEAAQSSNLKHSCASIAYIQLVAFWLSLPASRKGPTAAKAWVKSNFLLPGAGIFLAFGSTHRLTYFNIIIEPTSSDAKNSHLDPVSSRIHRPSVRYSFHWMNPMLGMARQSHTAPAAVIDVSISSALGSSQLHKREAGTTVCDWTAAILRQRQLLLDPRWAKAMRRPSVTAPLPSRPRALTPSRPLRTSCPSLSVCRYLLYTMSPFFQILVFPDRIPMGAASATHPGERSLVESVFPSPGSHLTAYARDCSVHPVVAGPFVAASPR
ncbi:uncharacterized protein PG986_006258 [Apiospora aurea]|uniref:Uncharacterized protein n=1 Tax=Apiospora aurea TaxID=335848 RepID=A0ABR1QJW3_9PEZI